MIDIHYSAWATRREKSVSEKIKSLREEYSEKSRDELQTIVDQYEKANFLVKIIRSLDPNDSSLLEYIVAKRVLGIN